MAYQHGRLTDWLIRHKARISQMGTGLGLYAVFNFAYDRVFYIYALAHWGLVVGGLIAAGGSLLCCSVLFWLYDHMKIDWLGAYALRELESKENKTRLERFATWISKEKKTQWERLANPFVFALLTFSVDPLIVAVHYRRQHFRGVGLRDWGILFASVAAANAWWILVSGSIVTLFLQFRHLFV